MHGPMNIKLALTFTLILKVLLLGPCHHGKARTQVVAGGMASSIDGSCKYIEWEVADSRQWVAFQLGDWASC